MTITVSVKVDVAVSTPTTNTKHRCGIWTVVSFPVFFAVVAFSAGIWAGGTCLASDGDLPVIRAGCEVDFPPYAYVDQDGEPAGFGVELLKTVAGKMGLRIRFTTGPWDQVWNGLVSGKLDVLPVVARTPGREPLVDFSLPHTKTFDAFFVREGQSAFPDLAAAAGKEIVVLHSDAAHHELVERKFSGKVVPVESISEGLRLIAAGKHDALLCSKLVGVLELGRAGVKGVQPGPPIPDYQRDFSFAVRKGDAELLEKLNQGLRIVKATGEYERIYQRWLSAEDPWRKWMPYFQASVAGLVVLGLLVATLQWLVRKRTLELSRARDALQDLNATLEQRVAERTAALRESEECLALAASGTRIGIFDRNMITGEIVATEQNVNLLGMKLPSAATTTTTTTTTTLSQRYRDSDWAERVHPDDLPRVEAEVKRCMAGHVPFECEYRVVGLDGTIRWVVSRGMFQYDDQGVPLRLLGVLMDISERKQAEQRLSLDLEAMTRLQKLGALFVHEQNLEPVFIEIVEAAMAITGADFGNIQILDPLTGDLRIVAQRGFPQWWLDYWNVVARGTGTCGTALEGGERVMVEDVERSPIFVGSPALDIQRRAGVRAVQSTPLVSRSGKTIGMFSTHYKTARRLDERTLRLLDLLARQAADIIDRAKSEAILQESEKRLRMAQSAGRLGIWDWDVRTDALCWTRELEEIYGVEPGSIRTFEDFRSRVHPDDLAVVDVIRKEAVAHQRGFEVEFRILQPGGNLVWVDNRGAAVHDEAGAAVRVLGVTIDITAKKLSENALRATIAEKDILMRELAHRTKNNMQVIGSLLGLQAATAGNERLAGAVLDAQDRIRAMALVHENLYRSGSLATLTMRGYLEDLVASFLKAHRGAGVEIKYYLDIEDLHMSVDEALPCGLIINELISNSLKHAFSGRKSGAIYLSMRRIGGRMKLCYRDDGSGLPRDLDPSQVKSLGLKLVHNLAVRQLRGTMEIRHDPETEFVFTFGGMEKEDSA